MALTGSLLDFNAADILQLIKLQQKDGVLVVRDRDRELLLRFQAGDVAMAERTGLGLVDAIGKYLLASGGIDAERWRQALESHHNRIPLDQALADQGVDADALMSSVSDYWRETALSLFTWAEGIYCFEVDATVAPPIEQLPPPLDTHALLMAATTQLDTLSLVVEKLEGLNSVFVVRSGADTTGLSEAQANALALVDGVRPAWQIADASATSPLVAYEALAGLRERGLLQLEPATERPTPPTGPHMDTPVSRSRQRRRAGQGMVAGLVGVACLGTVALCVGLFIGGLVMSIGGGGSPAGSVGLVGSGNEILQATWSYRDTKVRKALSAYRMVYGDYPSALSKLAHNGLISNPRTLSGMEYLKVGSGYTLHSD